VIEGVLTVLAIIAASGSAWLWIKASRVPMPPVTDVSWEGKGPFADALRLQSKLNAQVAMCAAGAAALQALALLVHLMFER